MRGAIKRRCVDRCACSAPQGAHGARLVFNGRAEQPLAHIRPAEVDAEADHGGDKERAHGAREHKLRQLRAGVEGLVRDRAAQQGKHRHKNRAEAHGERAGAERRPLGQHAPPDLRELVHRPLQRRHGHLEALVVDHGVLIGVGGARGARAPRWGGRAAPAAHNRERGALARNTPDASPTGRATRLARGRVALGGASCSSVAVAVQQRGGAAAWRRCKLQQRGTASAG